MKDYKEITIVLNKLSIINSNKILTGNEIMALLSNTNIYKTRYIITYLVKYGILFKIKHNNYQFSNKPIYYKKVENCLEDFKHFQNKTYNHSKILEAIKLLKENGYTIVKKIEIV